jgi:DNA-binding NtrC family response regulator
MSDLLLIDGNPANKTIGLIAAQDCPVIITGASGTGKDLAESDD